MSMYGLIKASSRAQRADTIYDLDIVNKYLKSVGFKKVTPYAPSVRALENSVALALEGIDLLRLPALLRGVSFYKSCLPEIKEKERKKFNTINNQVSSKKELS